MRQEVASKYSKALSEKVEERSEKGYDIVLPYVDERATSAWAQYSIRIKPSTFNLQLSSSLRDNLQVSLKEKVFLLQYIILFLYTYKSVFHILDIKKAIF